MTTKTGLYDQEAVAAARSTKRWFVTFIDSEGKRVIANPRLSWPTKAEADDWLSMAFRINRPETLEAGWGDLSRVEVRAVDCKCRDYEPTQVVFDE